MMAERCSWTKNNSENVEYHDNEWGVPAHCDKLLFEILLLETFQAGLSWLTILKKRKNFKNAFDNFDFEKIAGYDEKKISELVLNAGIIRNKLKIKAAISNAQAFLRIQQEFKSFDYYIWGFVNHKTIKNSFQNQTEIPATSRESGTMSKDLKKRGFKFIGSIICYAFMQAAGLVNNHEVSCFRYNSV